MSRILITGSSDGIGLAAARALISEGHHVVLHARNAQRAAQTRDAAPGAADILVADISTIKEMKKLAQDANNHGTFDVVIHNAGIGYQRGDVKTEDGIAQLFAVNSLAPYVLTALMNKPKRLAYLSSSMQSGGDGSLKDVTWTSGRSYNGVQAYSDSKLHDIMLAFAVAHRWKDVYSNAVDPGWVKTKMGGSSAPGALESGADTMNWLATVSDQEMQNIGTGKFFANRRAKRPLAPALETAKQDEFMRICEKLSGVPFPA